MFRLITAIALILMPIISVVTTETTETAETRFESRDLIDELGVRCPGAGCDPFAEQTTKFDDQ